MIKTSVHEDFFSLLKETWNDVTKNFWPYFFFLFIWTSIYALIIGGVLYSYDLSFSLPFSMEFFQSQGVTPLIWLGGIGAFFTSWLCVSYFRLLFSREKSVIDALVFGFPRFIAYFLLIFFTKFLVIGVSVFLLIPGIVLGIYFILSPVVFVSERGSIFHAMKKSMALIHGNFWVILWYLFKVAMTFFVLLLIPFANILAMIVLPIFVPAFLVALYRWLEKKYKAKKVRPKGVLGSLFGVAIIGYAILIAIILQLN